MGSFDDSRYRMCRKPRDCALCGTPIGYGVRYLDFKMGQRSSLRMCMDCSVKRTDDGRFQRWDCQVVRAELRDRERRAA